MVLLRQKSPPTIKSLTSKKLVKHVFRYGFIEIADDILFALLVGVVLGGVLFLALPSDLMAHEYARWLAYPVMVLIGIPSLYLRIRQYYSNRRRASCQRSQPRRSADFSDDWTGHQYGHHRDHRQPSSALASHPSTSPQSSRLQSSSASPLTRCFSLLVWQFP